MATTYTLINSNVLTSSQTSITFSSIPADYTDLVVRAGVRSDFANTIELMKITINGNSGSLYSMTGVYGTGTSPATDRDSGTSLNFDPVDAANNTANTFGNYELYIPSYLASQNKQVGTFAVYEQNSTANNRVQTNAGFFRSTTAISSISFAPRYGTNFVSGSSFYLYGISNA
mgnify:CR=1 FL=1|tara:strand:- start:1155 stop:1673 length:519 start_codon:yes stop_codon:yes gene_type:complete